MLKKKLRQFQWPSPYVVDTFILKPILLDLYGTCIGQYLCIVLFSFCMYCFRIFFALNLRASLGSAQSFELRSSPHVALSLVLLMPDKDAQGASSPVGFWCIRSSPILILVFVPTTSIRGSGENSVRIYTSIGHARGSSWFAQG